MSLICWVMFTRLFFPVAIVGEERVGLCRCIVNLSQAQAVGLVEESFVETGTAYDVDVFLWLTGSEELVPRIETLTSRQLLRTSGQHTVAAVGQSTFGQTLKRLPSHHDGMTCRQRLEPFQVVGQPVNQFILKADGPVLGDGSNDGNHSFRLIVNSVNRLIGYSFNRLID